MGFAGMDFDLDEDAFVSAYERDPTHADAIWKRPLRPTPVCVCYENSERFAEELTIDGETETFAYVAGGFVFGDFIEALVERDKLTVRRLGMQMLRLNDENVDSIRNVVEMCGTERLDLVLSGYWYATELRKGGVVGYLFSELDIEGLELHVAIAEVHCKVVTIETWAGHALTMQGSANLRSSNSVEQLMISPDRGLYDFCSGVTEAIIDTYDVVMSERRKANPRSKRLGGRRLWQAVASTDARGEAPGAEMAEARRSAESDSARRSPASAGQGPRADGMTSTERCPSDVGGDSDG